MTMMVGFAKQARHDSFLFRGYSCCRMQSLAVVPPNSPHRVWFVLGCGCYLAVLPFLLLLALLLVLTDDVSQ